MHSFLSLHMQMADIILITKRHDYISEVVVATKDKFIAGIQEVYMTAKAKNELRKYILRDFQLELKDIADWDDDKLRLEQARFVETKKMRTYIQSIFETNSVIYEGEHKVVSREADVMREFVHGTYLQIARELWKRPNIMQEIMEKKQLSKNLEYLEKIVVQAIKGTLRRGHRNLEMHTVPMHMSREVSCEALPYQSREALPYQSRDGSACPPSSESKSINVDPAMTMYRDQPEEDFKSYKDDEEDMLDLENEWEEADDYEEDDDRVSHKSGKFETQSAKNIVVGSPVRDPSPTPAPVPTSPPQEEQSNYIDALLFNPKMASRAISIVSSRSNSPTPSNSPSPSRHQSPSPSRKSNSSRHSTHDKIVIVKSSKSNTTSSSSSSFESSPRRGRSKTRKLLISSRKFPTALAKYGQYYNTSRPLVRKGI